MLKNSRDPAMKKERLGSCGSILLEGFFFSCKKSFFVCGCKSWGEEVTEQTDNI